MRVILGQQVFLRDGQHHRNSNTFMKVFTSKRILAGLFVLVVGVLLTINSPLMYPTEYAGGFSVEGFERVTKGDSLDKVVGRLGLPLSILPIDRQSEGLWLEESDTAYQQLIDNGSNFVLAYSRPKTGENYVAYEIKFNDRIVVGKRKFRYFD